jgi:hypothetical protein
MSMSDDLDQIFADFHKLLNRERDRRLMSLFASDRQVPRVAIERIFREFSNAPMFLGTAIHGLPSSEFSSMANLAVATLREDRNNMAAQEFIAYASIQNLASLRPHLRDLFDLQPNWTTYYAMWPWRESGTLEFEFLAERAAKAIDFWQGGPTRTAERAASEALLETGRIPA